MKTVPSPGLPALQARLLLNPAHAPQQAYGPRREAILNRRALATAQAAITAWPGYAATPLRSLPALARQLGVARIDYKDEGGRFGLGSFKALGGAYAVARQLCRVAGRQLGREVALSELGTPEVRAISAGVTVTCATDGNHGRSVAWGAQMFGCQCVIFVHATVSEGRQRAIAAFGARVVRTDGNYDDSVREADRQAADHGWHVISDTSYPGYMDVPRDVMQGYQSMVEEASTQWQQWPTHVFIQAGVGGFAAAVCGWFWERAHAHAGRRPRFIVVEPVAADCLYQSALAQQITAVGGDLDTLMAGLACGEVSHLAWDILQQGADAFAVIDDAAAVAAMRLLAAPERGDPLVVAGESAVAGLAAAIAIAQNPQQRAQLGIDAGSRLFFIGSEADTDAALYEQLVGQSAASLRAAHAVADQD
ncbi:diaminopropionate ammonia-lyase [Corticibacter populi]|uniref:Diaminopropionate ammonia-lyase n=1 Tax=Corticibacter populi TaxID=1550736 RepID=A0A3M6R079_9BURK|nr:diaminopropionate ammonia-lyase [Corticibacter populi]RMX08666.1 diaminopropionate ammonia-lyase [Corticibacter populi]RZS36003.1 diaminopropionate ammonia-lyase [Corticibacter populi]